jgi:hypothetical protein
MMSADRHLEPRRPGRQAAIAQIARPAVASSVNPLWQAHMATGRPIDHVVPAVRDLDRVRLLRTPEVRVLTPQAPIAITPGSMAGRSAPRWQASAGFRDPRGVMSASQARGMFIEWTR